MKEWIKGLKHLKESVLINAPVEVCYQAWINQGKFSEFMSKILDIQIQRQPEKVMNAIEETQALAIKFTENMLDPNVVKQWLISGPGGKVYQYENIVTLDIPNHLYSTLSTDPDDLCVQATTTFSPSPNLQSTLIEFQISFWESEKIKNGQATQLISDILRTNDSLFADCLQDLKRYIEAGRSLVIQSKGSKTDSPKGASV